MKKRFIAMLMALTLAVSMIVTVSAEEKTETASFKIVHTNDVHSRVAGEAYVASYVNNLRNAGENVILVSAGDVLHGQTIGTISKGETIVDIMNATGYELFVPGNHDFNYGIDRLSGLRGKMNFSILGANVIDAATDTVVYEDYEIREIAGLKVGFFGLSTPETATKTNPKNVVGIDFANPVEVAEEIVAKLQAENVDVIVCVAHLGIDEETLANERSTGVAAVEGIDIIIDGHSHSTLENGMVVSGTLIAQTGEYLNNIGVVEVNVTAGAVSATASLVATPSGEAPAWEADANVVATIAKAEEANEAITSQVIGSTPVTLDGEREDARTKETNLSALLTQSMLAATGADVAITNGGGIRASIQAGDITKGDVLTVLPFGNFICTVDVTGKAVWDALEHGVSAYPATAGHYSQVSGIKVEFDSSKPEGEKVQSITLANGEALDLTATYKLATNDFMVAGGDNYTMLAVSAGYMEYGSLDEALIDYIASGVDIAAIELGTVVDVASGEPATETPATETPATEAPAEIVVEEPAISAVATASTIMVDGEEVEFQAYNINDNNYFKLRDIAFVMNGSEKQFSVVADAESSAVNLVSGEAYAVTGNELSNDGVDELSVVKAEIAIYIDGELVELAAYNIGGNNYFKLRDLGAAFDFGIDWDAANSVINVVTAQSYAE